MVIQQNTHAYLDKCSPSNVLYAHSLTCTNTNQFETCTYPHGSLLTCWHRASGPHTDFAGAAVEPGAIRGASTSGPETPRLSMPVTQPAPADPHLRPPHHHHPQTTTDLLAVPGTEEAPVGIRQHPFWFRFTSELKQKPIRGD